MTPGRRERLKIRLRRKKRRGRRRKRKKLHFLRRKGEPSSSKKTLPQRNFKVMNSIRNATLKTLLNFTRRLLT